MPKGPANQQPVNPNPDWQDRDIRLKGVVYSLVAIALVTLFSFLAMDALFGAYDKKERARAEQASPLSSVRELPPGPLLQVTPRDELAQLQAVQRVRLESYEWVDPELGIVRIPIDRAMSILAERGLPVRNAEGGGE